ncbi:hypothetical protein K6V92_03510 [Cupriavidus respiraculi]|uniref:hypothetical protein n=1 Tax=Cupriavidus respiraculi TaxID=195930 RepID=UPI001C9600D3|nr:hypothetical protein [Cupriavidus respiraculi]MBY4945689.1 hypothetical protein [Cupriavidus respiraculi]
MSDPFTPDAVPPAHGPQVHRLRRGEVLECYARRGARLYVADGELLLAAAPSLLAGEVHCLRTTVPAGHCHRIGDPGRIALRAARATTFLWLAPAETSAAERIKGILSAWLRAWRRRPVCPSPGTTPAPPPQAPRSPQAIQGANT